MQLAVYDLVGALFAPSDPWPVSRHADKLFTRIRDVIKVASPIRISVLPGSGQSGDLVTLPSEALYASGADVQ